MFARGITLLELLVALIVVAVLAALAVPAYQRHLMRANRVEAMTSLQEVLAAQERFHLRHGRYASDAEATPPALRHYSITISLASDGQTFIATASPLPEHAQANDLDCLDFSVDQRGRRAVSGRGGVEKCWR